MSPRARRVQAILAGIGAFLVDVWPVVLVAWAGTSGSIGDLSPAHLLGVGLTFGVGTGILAGWLMDRALRRAARSPRLRPADAWGAYAFAISLYTVGLVLVPALTIFGLLLTDENVSLQDRFWLLALLWAGGRAAAAAVSVGAAAALLGRERTRSVPAPTR